MLRIEVRQKLMKATKERRKVEERRKVGEKERRKKATSVKK